MTYVAEPLTRPVTNLGRAAWVMYEWACQPFYALVTIFVFAAYFTAEVAPDPTTGQAYWGYIQASAGVLIALLSPILGAIADEAGKRKPWILVTSLIYVVAASMLWFAAPDPASIPLVAFCIIVTLCMMEYAHVFFYAMMPSLIDESKVGLLSGLSYGLSQLGAIIGMVMVLILFALPGTVDAGFIPSEPLFGINHTQGEQARVTGPFAAVWMLVFMIPLFLWTPDRAKTRTASAGAAVQHGLKRLGNTLRGLGPYKNVVHFLVARMLIFDGLNAVFVFGGVFAKSVFDWDTSEMLIFGMIVITCSAIGGMIGAWADPRFGSKPTIIGTLFVAMLAALAMVSMDVNHIFFFIPTETVSPDGLFTSTPEKLILAVACLFGMAVGPVLASSRTMLAKLSPHEKMTEFFGLYALAGKATSFLAPLGVAIVTNATGSIHWGFSVSLFFMVIGLIAFWNVKEQRAAFAG